MAALLSLLLTQPLGAQTDPWDQAVQVLQTAFTGSIAKGLSLVAIVVGGLMFAFGEGHSKKGARRHHFRCWHGDRCGEFHGLAVSGVARFDGRVPERRGGIEYAERTTVSPGL